MRPIEPNGGETFDKRRLYTCLAESRADREAIDRFSRTKSLVFFRFLLAKFTTCGVLDLLFKREMGRMTTLHASSVYIHTCTDYRYRGYIGLYGRFRHWQYNGTQPEMFIR
jgi:hypothetical protein